MHTVYRAGDGFDERGCAQGDVIGQQVGFRQGSRYILGNGSTCGDANRGIVKTQVFMACAAELAIPTIQVWLDGDSAANGYIYAPVGNLLGNIAPQCDYLARELVAGDDRVASQWRITINNM